MSLNNDEIDDPKYEAGIEEETDIHKEQARLAEQEKISEVAPTKTSSRTQYDIKTILENEKEAEAVKSRIRGIRTRRALYRRTGGKTIQSRWAS
ncbi:Hypothetical predicted protein [Mytilus galloprovincialis]|uniref:Uncharacterized protein n=1 Tax=Mytilus galloprovincialis TaxID=29158 RepID=A0A8B6HCY1_MYTGA|nr:Hypothetical predicted protein [Mytilus galloprovincialis]